MPTSNDSQRPLAELLAELEAAVRVANRPRAMYLEQTILQRLATEASEYAAVERIVRALMEKLRLKELRLERLARSLTLSHSTVIDPLTPERSATAPAPGEGIIYPVWFGTNRKPAVGGTGFASQRHDRITRGRVDVHVPEVHRFGETGSSFWEKLKRRDLRDDHLRVRQILKLERDAFFAELRQKLGDARHDCEPEHALFFLHGYNVTFEGAAIRAAQIGVDLKSPATAFFSWPSRGNVAAYPADEASIEASERAITDFLVEFSANCGAEKIHVIAHSMGNRGLLRALQRIAANAETRGKVRFGQVFLAAPDVDRDLFLDLARLYADHAERTTLYASDADLPVHLSSKIHAAPRAGYYLPYTVAPGVDTVAVPDFDLDLLGHSYFAQAEALLGDIFDLMRHNQAPAQRRRIAAALDGDMAFWKLRR
jgi:esterase/lipase superfamily enzyme